MNLLAANTHECTQCHNNSWRSYEHFVILFVLLSLSVWVPQVHFHEINVRRRWRTTKIRNWIRKKKKKKKRREWKRFSLNPITDNLQRHKFDMAQNAMGIRKAAGVKYVEHAVWMALEMLNTMAPFSATTYIWNTAQAQQGYIKYVNRYARMLRI